MKDKKLKRKEEHTRVSWGQRLSSYICPILLGASVCFAIVYIIYRPPAVPATLVFTGAEFLLFMLFDWLKTKRFLGGLLYTGLLIGAVALAMDLMFRRAMELGWESPVNWFYGEEGIDPNQPVYLAALLIGGGFFLTSVLYYFTQIRYRSLGVMLSILFPFFIYAKRADIMPDLMVTVIITLFLAVMVHNRRLDPSVDVNRRGILQLDRAYIISIAIFISLTGAVTMVIDKPVYRSQLERNSDFFDIYQNDNIGSGNYQDLSSTSSSRTGGLSYTNEPIFYFETDGELGEYYLRTQAFTYFYNNDWHTVPPRDYDGQIYSWDHPEYSVDDIMTDMKALGYDVPEEPYVYRKGRVFAEDFRSTYLPAPYGTVTDEGPESRLEYLKSDLYTEIKRRYEGGEPPTLDDRFSFPEYRAELYSFAEELGFEWEDYWDTLYDLRDEEPAAERLHDDYRFARWYYTYLEDDTSVELYDLAEEITKDCTSDYEKARALENWFTEAGFEYTLEYIPENISIDYFLFQSRKGYCASYATAMTLMARSLDLPARYVEGFAAYERTIEGNIVVRDGHAHAFVEVYIPGAGWMTFDPTVADYRNLQLPEEDNNGFSTALMRFMSRFLIVIIVGAAVIFLLLVDRIKELFVRIRLRFKEPGAATLLLYRNLVGIMERSAKADFSAYTVKMLRGYLYSTRTMAPEKLMALFERKAFGGIEPTREEFREAYEEYKAMYRYLRRIPSARELDKLRAASVKG